MSGLGRLAGPSSPASAGLFCAQFTAGWHLLFIHSLKALSCCFQERLAADLFGFSLAFSDGGALNGVIGNPFSFAMLENVPDVWDGLAIPGLSFALFQGMFAIITPALISGALVERISFRFWCVFTPLWLLVVYAPLAHMLWGGGCLGKDLDFAGGTVVHISSGVSALLLAGLVAWRKKWPNSIRPPHDVTQILLGTGLLWFGWFGFNGGSQFSVHGAELPFTTTHISAAIGLVACRLLKHGVVESPLPLAWQPVPWPDWLASPLEPVLSRLQLGWRSVQSPDCFATAPCSSRFHCASMTRSTPLPCMGLEARLARF